MAILTFEEFLGEARYTRDHPYGAAHGNIYDPQTEKARTSSTKPRYFIRRDTTAKLHRDTYQNHKSAVQTLVKKHQGVIHTHPTDEFHAVTFNLQQHKEAFEDAYNAKFGHSGRNKEE